MEKEEQYTKFFSNSFFSFPIDKNEEEKEEEIKKENNSKIYVSEIFKKFYKEKIKILIKAAQKKYGKKVSKISYISPKNKIKK